jgi:hypothetical protein
MMIGRLDSIQSASAWALTQVPQSPPNPMFPSEEVLQARRPCAASPASGDGCRTDCRLHPQQPQSAGVMEVRPVEMRASPAIGRRGACAAIASALAG